MKKLLIILMLCISTVLSATNTLKYNGKTDIWTGKWQMSDSYEYKVKHEAFSGKNTGYYVTKHNCKVTITVFAEENLIANNTTVFKMSYDDCPYLDSAVVSAYDGNTLIGYFHRAEAEEASYINQSTSYFGIKMLKNITRLSFFPHVYGERLIFESVGLHCNDDYEPSKEDWYKNYYCLNSDSIAEYKKHIKDSIAETKCLAKKNMVWIFNKCEKIKTCKASEDYLETTNICVKKELPFINVHWTDSTYTTIECDVGFIKSSNDESEWYCERICNADEYLNLKTNYCITKPNCSLHEEIEIDEYGYYNCSTVYKPMLAEWDNDTTNTYHCVENAVQTYSGCDCSYGYYQVGNKCVKEPVCGQHQYLSNYKCYDRTKPNNSHWFDDYRWVCDDGYFQFDEKCYSNCSDDEYFETSYHGCRELPKKAVKINMYTYTCPEGMHDEYDECVSDPIDWSFIKNVSHLYFDFDVGSNSCYSKYYDTEMCIGTSLTFGYNFAIGIIDNYFQIGLNLNTNLMINGWNTIDNEYIYDDGVTEFYNALTIGSGIYIKLLNAISYTGYAMLPLLDTDFDNDYINIKGLLGTKISIDGEHISIYFKYVYGDKFFNYKGVGFSYRF